MKLTKSKLKEIIRQELFEISGTKGGSKQLDVAKSKEKGIKGKEADVPTADKAYRIAADAYTSKAKTHKSA